MILSRRWRPAVPAALILVARLALSAPGPAAAATPPTATFNPSLLLPNSTSAAEPSIRTDRFGRSFVIGPTGVPAGCKAFRVSHDGSSAAYLGFPDHTAGGGDCDLAIGPQETSPTITPAPSDDVIAYSSLTAAEITCGKSDDGGATFGPPNPACAQVGGDDRMWQAADPKLNDLGFADVYMTYHDLAQAGENIQLSVSRDGGQTYVQSAPIINPTEVPTGQWELNNELGNIVAYRSPGGSLTLFSIFATPDSAIDNASQQAALTANYNRIYEAVGTVVSDPGAPSPPVLAWHNYEIWHGPVGARYNRIFPVTAVDAAGHVYAFWTDGLHILTKTSTDGTSWGCPADSTPPGGPNPCTPPTAIPNPTGVNVTVMPWAAAGRAGIVDAVFYGAQGPVPGDNDNSGNSWNVYMAQTLDGGASWGVFQASDHVIHRGAICLNGFGCSTDRTLLDFFQVSIDPTNGAADIAYADDHASPGTAVLYFTRQCTGASATTGSALTNDCVPPPPPPPIPQGTTCPGPQVVDLTGDAPNNYPGGDGSNIDAMDIVNASFATPDPSTIEVRMTIKDLEAPPPPANLVSGFWTVYWTYNGVTYFAQATSNGTGSTAVWSFSDGTYTTNFNPVGTPNGTVTTGPGGTIVMDVPRSDVGNPPDGATLGRPFADTHGSFTVEGTGVYYTAPADRAPDSGYGADYVVGQTCQADLSVTKTGPTTGHVGQALTYTIVVKNLGGDAAQGVTVTDTLPKNAGFGSVSTTQGSCAPKPKQQLVTCSIGTMAKGSMVTVTLVVKPTVKGNFKDTATVSETAPGDPNPSNDTSSVTTKVSP